MKRAIFAGLIAAGFMSPNLAQATNLLINGGFESGNSGFTTDYDYTPFITAEGQYTITPAGSINSTNSEGDWTSITTDPQGGNSNVLLVNGTNQLDETVWSETISGLAPNTNYIFSFQGADVDVPMVNARHAILDAFIDGSTSLGTLTTDWKWQALTVQWNSGASTSALLRIVDTQLSHTENDFAMDDISFATVAATPIPTSLPLFVSGFAALAGIAWRRSNRVTR